MEHSYEKHFQIRSCEMDMWRRPRVTALLNYLQDAATDHATSLGVGVAALASQNLAWVVSRYHVKLLGSASRGDMVSVHTWPATRDTYFSRRDFEVLLHGVPIAIASSTWAAVDLTSRRSVRLCDRVPEYPVVNHQAMPDRQDQLPAVKVPGTEVTFRVKVNDLDLNRHVGNAVDQNRAWNVRILNLMARSGLVRLKPSPSADEEPADSDEGFGENMIDVDVTTGEAMSKDSWSARIENQRQIIQGAERRAWGAIQAAASGGQCMGSVLGDYYRATWSSGRLTTEINCRGCPHCRSHRDLHESGLYRQGLDPHPAVHAWRERPPDPLRQARGGSPLLAIAWRSAGEHHDRVPDLLVRLARRGMGIIGGPGCLGDIAERLQRDASPFPVIVDTDHDLLRTYDGPIIWLLGGPREINIEIRQRLQGGGITYLVHAEPSIDDASPAERSYDDIPTLSVVTALGAL